MTKSGFSAVRKGQQMLTILEWLLLMLLRGILNIGTWLFQISERNAGAKAQQ